ncbi:hypothetical protein [Mesonia sp. K7]|uniref:hypothetical protein n=1 Tax=Mesonia sp. K7 TaxID=2218606 RepID=UPI000DA77D38|nr:hypothetical protein [Mesonia sp. K7]PZD77238.1 hypothetical protein DNG35_09195 [Mesonia sp. K7]
MKTTILKNLVLLFIPITIVGCNDGNKSTEKKTLCFESEYPHQTNPDMKDAYTLEINVEGDKVTGTYNWFPAEKDQRKGTFSGTVEEHIVDAVYTFEQEGQKQTTNIKIYYDKEKATVLGESPELGLGAKIKKVACE